jgi:hypothetical protein
MRRKPNMNDLPIGSDESTIMASYFPSGAVCKYSTAEDTKYMDKCW